MREFPARPIVGIGVVLFRGDAVLLVQRGRAPMLGLWSFPGGAQRVGETVEMAARRELREETGLEAGVLHLAGIADSIIRVPDGRAQFHYTILDLCGMAAPGEARAGGDATALAWSSFEALESFDTTPGVLEMVAKARQALRRA